MIVTAEAVHDQLFDYVIIGGGTAGLVLAARLTEDPNVTVLVLEAGQANIDDPELLRPATFGSHFGNEAYAWDHKAIARKQVNERRLDWCRGKGLGGSSAINFLCYSKPPSRDIDDLERLGNPGWNWENLSLYFQRAECFMEPSREYKRRTGINFDHWKVGKQGPLKLAFPPTISEGDVKIHQAFVNAGISESTQPLGGDPKGSSFFPSTYDPEKHERSYSTTAYYLPNKDRPNYKVVVGAHVTRVLTREMKDGMFTAVGVEFIHSDNGKTYLASVKKEVELCAGTFKTPQILELSGFGRKDVLEKIGVPVKVELPGVGENMQDHVFVGMSWGKKKRSDDAPFETLDALRDPAEAAKHLELYKEGKGLHTSGIVGFSWCSLDMFASEAKRAEIYNKMKNAINELDPRHSGLKEQYKIALERFQPDKPGSPGSEFISFPALFSGPNLPESGKKYVSILVAINHAWSRGTVHCTSTDPTAEPEIDAGYYKQSVDLDVHVEMVKFARKVAGTAPFKDMIAKELNPGSEVQSDDRLAEWITNNYTASSCSMLPRNQGGVVDPDLKVYGTNNLRVVDLSIVPLHFAAPSQSTVYAIAEKAADIIRSV